MTYQFIEVVMVYALLNLYLSARSRLNPFIELVLEFKP